MRNPWIRFGCFLTGYNYNIVQASSEISAKAVKRYTSALLIVCILWSFIGFTFTTRYLHGSLVGSCAGALVMVIIVIQIERQIIFKEDIELEKITFLENRVNKALPAKTEELHSQILALDTAIQKKDAERIKLIDDVGKNPVIKSTSTTTSPTKVNTTTTDSLGKVTSFDKIVNATSVITTNIPNPKQALIAPLAQTLADLTKEKSDKENALLNIRPKLEEEIKSKVGFLDELKVMASLIQGSRVALFVWLVWFSLLFGLELLVLISKAIEKKNDYEETIAHQMKLQMKKLEVLARLAQAEK